MQPGWALPVDSSCHCMHIYVKACARCMRAQEEQAGTKALAQGAAAHAAALEAAQRASQNRLDDLATRLGAVEDWSGTEEAQNQLLRRCARLS